MNLPPNLTTENLLEWLEAYPHWVEVELDPTDAKWIEDQGIVRNNHGKKKGWTSKTKDLKNDWHISGVAGEFAASLLYEIPIDRITAETKEELNEGDLGGFVESKTSAYDVPDRWNLIVNKDHLKEDRPYVLTLTCLFPRYLIIVGWAWGRDIKKGVKTTNRGTGHEIYLYQRHKLKKPIELFEVLGKTPPSVLRR